MRDQTIPVAVIGASGTTGGERALELASGATTNVSFVPHLCLSAAYARKPFVRVLPPGEMVDTKRAHGLNLVELQAVADARTGTAIVVGVLDNLVKGATGQAIQNLNLMAGFDEVGLPATAVYP